MANVMFSVREGHAHHAKEIDHFLSTEGWDDRLKQLNSTEGFLIDWEVIAGELISYRIPRDIEHLDILRLPFTAETLDCILPHSYNRVKDNIGYVQGIESRFTTGTVHFYGPEKELMSTMPGLIRNMEKSGLSSASIEDLRKILQHYGKAV